MKNDHIILYCDFSLTRRTPCNAPASAQTKQMRWLPPAGSPDGNSQHQGESRARLSPTRLLGSPGAAASPARLQAVAHVAGQQLRCSQKPAPAQGALPPCGISVVDVLQYKRLYY